MADLLGISAQEEDVGLPKILERKIKEKVGRNTEFWDSQENYPCMRIKGINSHLSVWRQNITL